MSELAGNLRQVNQRRRESALYESLIGLPVMALYAIMVRLESRDRDVVYYSVLDSLDDNERDGYDEFLDIVLLAFSDRTAEMNKRQI